MDKKIRAALSGGLALALGIAGIGVASSRHADGDGAMSSKQPNTADRVSVNRQQGAVTDESSEAEGADDKRDNETPITGTALQKASDAALAYLADRGMQGRVSETEVGDQESYYEVEVTLANGRQLDVHLDRDFTVLAADGDGNGSDH